MQGIKPLKTIESQVILKSLSCFLFILGLFSWSCGKDPSNAEIRMALKAPLNGSQVAPGDTVRIRSVISTDGSLDRLTISLLNNAGATVCQSLIVPANGVSDMQLDTPFAINNRYLSSGSYQLRLTAELTTGEQNFSIVMLNISELPLLSKGLLLVTTPSPATYSLQLLDTTGFNPTGISWQGDYSGSGFYLTDQIFAVSGSSVTGIVHYDLQSGSMIHSIPACGSPGTCFVNGNGSEGRFFVSWFDGQITGYNSLGAVTFSTVQNTAFYIPHYAVVSGNYLYAKVNYPNPGEDRLAVLFYPSGQAAQEKVLPMQGASIIPVAPYGLLIAGQQNGQAGIWEHDRLTNSINYRSSIPGTSIAGSVNWSGNRCFISTDAGTFLYDADNLSWQNISNLSSRKLLVDYSTDELILYNDFEINRISLNTWTAVSNVFSPFKILDIHAWTFK